MTLIDRLKLHEGTKRNKAKTLHVPYRDSENLLTIGYGILIDEAAGGGLYEEEAEFLLNFRMKKALESAQGFDWFSGLSQVRQEVVVEMIYNLGLTRFLQFRKMIDALERKDYDTAAAEGLESKWATQVKGRAVTLMELLKRGAE